jgi:hypothetical protein
MLDKLNPKITYKLFTKLVFILETNSFKASVILTNSYVSFDLINHILTVNKQSPSLKDKCTKTIRDNQDWKIQNTCLLYKGRLIVLKDNNLCIKLL